jgi:hypothetical protein
VPVACKWWLDRTWGPRRRQAFGCGADDEEAAGAGPSGRGCGLRVGGWRWRQGCACRRRHSGGWAHARPLWPKMNLCPGWARAHMG